jgi:hypothetical protein
MANAKRGRGQLAVYTNRGRAQLAMYAKRGRGQLAEWPCQARACVATSLPMHAPLPWIIPRPKFAHHTGMAFGAIWRVYGMVAFAVY